MPHMARASAFIQLLLMGSVMTALAYEKSRHEHSPSGYYDTNGQWHPATQPSSYSNGDYSHGTYYYYHTVGGGYSGGYSTPGYSAGGYSDSVGHSSSGISHGGFGATGHAIGGHS